MKAFIIIMILFSIGFAGLRFALAKPMRSHFGIGLFISFAVITFSGLMLHNTAIFMVICVGTFLATVRSRMGALCRFVILAALVPAVHFSWRIGSALIADISSVEALSFALAIALLFYRDRGQSTMRRPVGWEELVVMIVVAIWVLGPTHDYALTPTLRLFVVVTWQLALPYYLISRYTRDWQEFSQISLAIAGTAIILSVLALYEAKFGWALFDTVWRNLEHSNFVSRNLRVRAGLLRSPVTFNESTSFAVFQMVGVLAIASAKRSFRSPMLWRGALLMASLGLIVAQSRGAFIGIMLGIMVVLAFQRRFGRMVAMIVVAVGGVGMLLAAAPSSPKIAAFLGMEGTHGASDYRQSLFRRGLEEGLHHPLLGEGMDRVMAQMTDLTQGEHIIDMVNTYLTIFLQSGIVGLAAFVVPILLLFGRLWIMPRGVMADPGALRVRGFTVGALASVLVALLFTSFYERNPLWMMIAIAGAKVLSKGANMARRQPNGLTVGNVPSIDKAVA